MSDNECLEKYFVYSMYSRKIFSCQFLDSNYVIPGPAKILKDCQWLNSIELNCAFNLMFNCMEDNACDHFLSQISHLYQFIIIPSGCNKSRILYFNRPN